MPHRLFGDEAALADLCHRHRIRRLSLFGSTLKGADRPDSDIDLLIEFEPGGTPGLLTMAQIEIELSELVGGRRVDLRTPGDPAAISATRWSVQRSRSLTPGDAIRIRHMIEAAPTAQQFMAGCSRADLDSDTMLVFALVQAVQIIGEAASRISPEARSATQSVPWGRIIGMRNRLVHAYADIDREVIWNGNGGSSRAHGAARSPSAGRLTYGTHQPGMRRQMERSPEPDRIRPPLSPRVGRVAPPTARASDALSETATSHNRQSLQGRPAGGYRGSGAPARVGLEPRR